MTPVTTRPSLDEDRTMLTVGGFTNAFISEKTCKQIQALSTMLGVPIELVPVYERYAMLNPEASGAEVDALDY